MHETTAARLRREGLIPLREAARLFPEVSPGRTIRVASLVRWCRSKRLEGLKSGRHWYTSEAAVNRCLAGDTEKALRGDRLAAEGHRPEKGLLDAALVRCGVRA